MVFDDEGNQIGVEYFRTVFDENGKAIGEEKIDKEAERKAREEKQKRLEEEGAQDEEEFAVQSALTVGEDDEEDEEDEEDEKKRKSQEIAKKLEAIKQLPDGDEKRAEMAKLFTVEQVTTTSWVPLGGGK